MERKGRVIGNFISTIGETGRIATLLFVVKLYSTTLKVILPLLNQMELLTLRMSSKSNCMSFLFTFSIIPFSFHFSGIIEDGGTREHSFGIVTPERTYHLTSETEQDKRYIIIQ